MAKYRVGIIGCGSHGTRIARAFQLNPLTEVVAGANRGQEGLDLFCSRFDVPGWMRASRASWSTCGRLPGRSISPPLEATRIHVVLPPLRDCLDRRHG